MKTRSSSNKTLSLNKIITGSLAGVISRIFDVSPDKVKDSPATRRALVNAVNNLKGREVMAITLRAIGMSHRDAGKVMGVSGERVRYNEAKGLRKLRHLDRFVVMREHFCSVEPLSINNTLRMKPDPNRNNFFATERPVTHSMAATKNKFKSIMDSRIAWERSVAFHG